MFRLEHDSYRRCGSLCASPLRLGYYPHNFEFKLRIDLAEFFAEAQDLYGEIQWKLPADEALQKLLEFVSLRAKNYFVSHKNHDVVLVDAVLAAGAEDIWAANERLEALAEFSRKPQFEQAVLTFKRASNIIRKLAPEDSERITGAYRAELLAEQADKDLAAKLEEIAPRFDALWKEDKFAELFELLQEIRPVVDAFFDQVMVMSDDRNLRENRLNLLKFLVDRLGALADFNALNI